jgi:sterol desaturase/sphingolipid hydroxylase (fatty acid hydroxylase superfamily)
MALWEALAPRRTARFSRRQRWPHNLGLLFLDALLVRLLVAGAAIAVALVGEAHAWGLMNTLAMPDSAKLVLAIVLLDLVIYFQHVLFHAVPVLWRLHRVHHSDIDFDVTTGARFHPVEILLSAAIKMAAVAASGAPAVAVLVFEVVLNATATFNHSNGRLPIPVDRWLRFLIVTPDMHRVHHSVAPRETNSNFGLTVPWWDRLFGTYRAQPAAGHADMSIGVTGFRTRADLRIDRLLLQPFRDTAGGYAVNRRPKAPHTEQEGTAHEHPAYPK